jgi:hypothetical protein
VGDIDRLVVDLVALVLGAVSIWLAVYYGKRHDTLLQKICGVMALFFTFFRVSKVLNYAVRPRGALPALRAQSLGANFGNYASLAYDPR